MAVDDEAYCKLITTLYQPTPQTIPVEIRCSYCSKPKACTMNVQTNVLNGETDAQMSMNRNKRIEFWNELNASLMDKAAMATASIEHIARTLANMASVLPPSSRNNVQPTGRSVFYLITSSLGENELLFSVASDSYSHSLRSLGEVKLVRNAPHHRPVSAIRQIPRRRANGRDAAGTRGICALRAAR